MITADQLDDKAEKEASNFRPSPGLVEALLQQIFKGGYMKGYHAAYEDAEKVKP